MTFKLAAVSFAAMMFTATAVSAEPSVDPVASGSATTLTVPGPTAVAAAVPIKKQRVRCRTDYEIGSLVKKTRRCGDAATWDKSDAAARDQVRIMQDELKGRIGSN